MSARWACRAAVTLAIALAMTGLSACEREVTGPSLVLRVASGDKGTDDTAPFITHLAEEVDRRSGGTIRIEPVWRVNEGRPRADQLTVGMVVDGTYELAMVPARAFDDLGVDTLPALSAPFLVTSQSALDAVLSSGVRQRLLEGMDPAGVVGLEILPGALRHPFGYTTPLVGLADYHHVLIQAPHSLTAERLFHALGADVTEFPPPDLRGGVESQYSRAPAGVRYATGNVTFYPRTDVLVVDRDVRDRLREDQWSVLVDAAEVAREWQGSQRPSDLESASDFCDRGGLVVAARDDELADLREAAATVTTWLRRDPDTASLIDEISAIVAEAPDDTALTACPGRSNPATALDGVYRARVTRGTLLRAGANPTQAQENSGRWTWTLDHGTYTFHTDSSRYLAHPDGSGSFTFDGRTLVVVWDEDTGDYSTLTVRVDDDGDLHFSDVRENLADSQALGDGFWSAPWRRVGGRPG